MSDLPIRYLDLWREFVHWAPQIRRGPFQPCVLLAGCNGRTPLVQLGVGLSGLFERWKMQRESGIVKKVTFFDLFCISVSPCLSFLISASITFSEKDPFSICYLSLNVSLVLCHSFVISAFMFLCLSFVMSVSLFLCLCLSVFVSLSLFLCLCFSVFVSLSLLP